MMMKFLNVLKKIKKILRIKIVILKKILNNIELNQLVAKDISEGKIVGWFQGKMEWGPRALGNRSILGDPRRKDMKDILNKK